jgi:hypothetical protein
VHHLRWSTSEARLAVLGTPDESLGPTVLSVLGADADTDLTREVPDHCGLNLAWLPDESGVAVQLGQLGRDHRGREFLQSAGLWRWTPASDAWELLPLPELSESSYLLADGVAKSAWAFFDPEAAGVFVTTPPDTSVARPDPARMTDVLTPSHPATQAWFAPDRMTDLLISPDALLNRADVRQSWLMDGDELRFALRLGAQHRHIAGAAAPDGKRFAVPLGLLHHDALAPQYRHHLLNDLWQFAPGELPRQLTYRDDLTFRRPCWDPTSRLLAVETGQSHEIGPGRFRS